MIIQKSCILTAKVYLSRVQLAFSMNKLFTKTTFSSSDAQAFILDIPLDHLTV